MKRNGTAHLTALSVVLLMAPADALAFGSPTPKRVLVVYSFRHGLPAHDVAGANEMVNQGIRSVFERPAARRVRLHLEYLDLSTLPDQAYFQQAADDLATQYSELKMDVIIAVNFRAVRFLMRHGRTVFPECPIVFCGVEKRRTKALEPEPNMTGVLQEAGFGETIAAALQILPDTKRVFVVVGISETDRFIEAVASQELEPYKEKIDITYPTDRSLEGLLDQVANLPDRSVVLFLTLLQSASAGTVVPSNIITMISQASAVPTFGPFDSYLGYGIVGGNLNSFEAQGRAAAELALRILTGEKPANIPVVEAGTKRLIFDWRQLQRWGISEKRLPPGSIVRHKELSIWAVYKWHIIGLLTLCVAQAILIIALLANRGMRRRAEKSLEERLLFEALVSELSAALGDRDTAELDERIAQWVPRVAAALNADRCALIEFSESQAEARVVQWWAIDGTEPPPLRNHESKFRWCHQELSKGQLVRFSRLDELPSEAEIDSRNFAKNGFKSHLAVPLAMGDSVLGAFTFDQVSKERVWADALIQRILLVGEIFANALERRRADLRLQNAFTEINQLKDRLERENVYLRKEREVNYTYDHIIGESDAIKKTLTQVEQVAATETTVLLLGETGTGKDLLAATIHQLSDRQDRAMVKINCAALPPPLIESELFGREKGAYTGAQSSEIGRFEVADGSTIFLDEVGELSLDLQAKLLRVLEDGQFERLGSPKPVRVDVRVIAATNRDLDEAVRQNRFRQDLYYRLNVFPITVPPLRKRTQDIPLLGWAFVEEFAKRAGKTIDNVRQQDMEVLQQYRWPGNVRELRNVIERAVILTAGSTLQIDAPQAAPTPQEKSMLMLRDVERRHILEVLERTGWRVRGQDGAAELLGLKPSTLESRMAKLGIRRS